MILVFGAGGFIGTYLVDQLLEEGFEVIASDVDPIAEQYYKNKKIPFVYGDIAKEILIGQHVLKQRSIHAVVNVACLQPVNVSNEDYQAKDYIKVNVIGTLNVLDYCRNFGIKKVIHTISHRGVQGLWERGETITERSVKALKYTGSYAMFAISECAAQDCLTHYAQQYNVLSTVLRLPPVYGYGPHLEGYAKGKPIKSGFMTFIENSINSKPIELWGDVDKARDIIYVKDVVSAIILALKADNVQGLYNISSGRKTSLKQEALAIHEVFAPASAELHVVYRPELSNDVESFVYDISKAKKDLQWEPKYNLHDMLFDIKKEMELKRFEFLVEKRREQFWRNK